MEASELRIGNWVNSIKFNQPVQLELADFGEAYAHADGSNSLEWFETHLEGIPLDEQWLERFGFEWETSKKTHIELKLGDENIIAFYFQEKEIKLLQFYSTGPIGYIEFNPPEYVHQLQNLYFALSNTGLKVKEYA